MKKYKITTTGLEFKNILSGPAPVGRILNYIYLAGTTGLNHKNGNRQTDLANKIGDAWCTEFMIGLGLVRCGDEIKNTVYKLELTSNGTRIYNFLKNNYAEYDEGFRKVNITSVKNQIIACSEDFYMVFKNIFINSYPFLILKEYLAENGYSFETNKEFYEDFFETVASLYGDDAREAGFNRVPSLIQLCQLFDFAEFGRGINFKRERFEAIDDKSLVSIYEFQKDDLLEEAEKVERMYDLGTDISRKYGEDGNVIISSIVRNSELQKKFKNNLSIEQNHECVICGLKTKKLLIGSHIKPSASCDVYEKADTQNGLLLCANHDKLFDKYLISFDPENGGIHIRREAISDEYIDLKLDDNYHLPEELLTDKRKKYLENHYNEFKKRKR